MLHVKKTIKLVFSLLIFFQVFSSFGQQNESTIENILLNCLTESYRVKAIDIEKELTKLEKYLVENGSLQSTSGQAIYDFYKQVISTNDITTILNYKRFDAIYKLNPNEYYSNDCLQKLTQLDSSEIANSKYYQLSFKMHEVAQERKVTPSKISEIITSVLSPSDFQKPYYRIIGLLAIAYTGNSDFGQGDKNEQRKTINYSGFSNITIKASARNEIIVNGRTVDKNIFMTELAAFISKYQSKHLIELLSDNETSYGFYLKIQHSILEIYSSLRNKKAIEIFNKSYSDLTIDEQKQINEIYPISIKE